MAKIIHGAPVVYNTVGDVPCNMIFKAGKTFYLKAVGHSECDCNVIDLETGMLNELPSHTRIVAVYPDAEISLGKQVDAK